MTIDSIKLFKVAVPLKKSRQACFVRAVGQRKPRRPRHACRRIVGYGEGVPRPYVTGETLESAFAALEAHDWARIDRPAGRVFAQVVERLESLTLPEIESDPRGMFGNAARVRSRAGDSRCLWPAVRRIGGPSRRAGECRWARAFSEPPAGSLQRGDHGRVAPRRADLGLEDADLRLPPGENQSRNARPG